MTTYDRYELIQISDTHLVGAGTLFEGIDSQAHLELACAAVRAAERTFDAILLTGDLVDGGGAEAYRRLSALVDELSAEVGVPAIYAPGNHDDPELFSDILGTPIGADGTTDYVTTVGGLRIVVLDSNVRGAGHGELRPHQFRWLAEILDEPADDGTVVVVHHPPLPSTSLYLEDYILDPAHRAQLADVLRGTDVRIVVSGHYHQPIGGVLAGIPVWAGGAVSYTGSAFAPAGLHQGLRLPTISKIQLHPDTAFGMAHPLLTEPPVYTMSTH
ncbi:metallophosphoesterase family protein [Nocardia higoensis]|uniref:metallophosphoesterase family protein n=1 Tax=Nocardia higoensis TaxID=228599 RepID=UPI0002F95C81|nr:metallophosphoesterase [Nocardia higoensis]